MVISFFHNNRQSQSKKKKNKIPKGGILIHTTHNIKKGFAFVANDF